MHSNERLLVYYCYLMLLYFYSIFISVIYSFYLPCNRIVYMCDSLNAITTKLNLYHRFSFFSPWYKPQSTKMLNTGKNVSLISH